MELLDAVARLSLNSQQQTRKLCATVWDFCWRGAPQHDTTRAWSRATPKRIREGTHTRG